MASGRSQPVALAGNGTVNASTSADQRLPPHENKGSVTLLSGQPQGLEVTHSQALEMIAQSENYPNWDAARGSLAKKTAEPSMSLPDDHVWQSRQATFQRTVNESLSALGFVARLVSYHHARGRAAP